MTNNLDNTEINTRPFRVLPLSIGLETKGGIVTPLILRGTLLPVERSEVFSTAEDNQASVQIKVLMGESPIASKNMRIGSFEMSVPQQKSGIPQISVTFQIDRTCNVTIVASVGNTSIKNEKSFRYPLNT